MENKLRQTEEKKDLERYEKLVTQARDEIAWIRSVYKWVFGCITVIFVVGVTFAVIFIGKDLNDIKNRLNDKVEILGQQVSSRIDKEFKKENIHNLVENKAKENVEKVVDSYLAETTERINKKVITFEEESQKMTASLDKLNERAEFIFNVTLANNDDMSALRKLKELANDKNYTYRTEIQKAYDKIVKLPKSPIKLVRNINWNEGIDPSKFTLKDLIRVYNSEGERNGIKSQLIQYILERDDFEEKEKLAFLISVFENDNSIETNRTAGEYFIKVKNLKIYPLETDKMVEWWKTNKDTIK